MMMSKSNRSDGRRMIYITDERGNGSMHLSVGLTPEQIEGIRKRAVKAAREWIKKMKPRRIATDAIEENRKRMTGGDYWLNLARAGKIYNNVPQSIQAANKIKHT